MPSRIDPTKLLGEASGLWTSPDGTIIVPELPGDAGQPLPRALSNEELLLVSKHFEGVEFGQTLVENAKTGEQYWLLESGNAGDYGQIRGNPREQMIEMGQHTHPDGYNQDVASPGDRSYLEAVQELQADKGLPVQQTGTIIMADGTVFEFSVEKPNLSKPELNYPPTR